MAEWRERGYVPDSDSDDGTFETQLAGLNVNKNGAISCESGASQLPAESKDDVIEEQEQTTEFKGVQLTAQPELIQRVSTPLETLDKEDDGVQYGVPFPKHAVASKGDSDNVCSDQPETQTDGQIGIAAPVSSVGEQLQAELRSGLDTVREILYKANGNDSQDSPLRSASSSPLSSVRSYPDENEDPGSPALLESHSPPQATHTTATPLVLQEQHRDPPRQYARALRERQAIQIHPYMLEDMRYREELKDRGLKPVRVIHSALGRLRSPTAFETQNQDVFSSSPMPEPLGADSSLERESESALEDQQGPTVPLESPSGQRERLSDFQDELPDLSAILEGGGGPPRSFKRRRLGHKSYKEARQVRSTDDPYVFELPSSPIRLLSNDNDLEMLDVPPSPPHSGSSLDNPQSTLSRPGAQLKSRKTPRALPTPAVSSAIRPEIPTKPASLSSSSTEEAADNDTDGESENSPLASEAEEQHGRGVQGMQRRIKGVLPASWLTLDLEKQANIGQPRRRLSSFAEQQGPAKGVARKLPGKKRHVRAPNYQSNAISISDVESPDEEPSRIQNVDIDRIGAHGSSSLLDSHVFEAIEDHEPFDIMAPPRAYTSRRRRNSKTKQTRIDETFKTADRDLGCMSRKRQQARHGPTPNLSARRPRFRGHKPSLPRLRLLDALAMRGETVDDQPSFVRVAARRTDSGKDSGRRNTVRKFFSFSNRDETAEVESQLSDWREGRIHQGSSTQLQPQTVVVSDEAASGAQTHGFDDTISRPLAGDVHLATLKRSTNATIQRIIRRQVGQNTERKEATTSRLETRAAASDHSVPRRRRPEYQNRSGKGQLISSLGLLAPSRAAQAEMLHLETLRSGRRVTFGDRLPQVENEDADINLAPAPWETDQAPLEPMDMVRQGQTSTSTNEQAGSSRRLALASRRKRRPRKLHVESPAQQHQTQRFLNAMPPTLDAEIRDLLNNFPADYDRAAQILSSHFAKSGMSGLFGEPADATPRFLTGLTLNTQVDDYHLDTGFALCLKLVFIAGQRKANATSLVSLQARSSFVSSLIPNSQQILHKDAKHSEEAFHALRNRFGYYFVLHVISPDDYKPLLLSRMRDLVDYERSHFRACMLACQMWQKLVRYELAHGGSSEILHQLSVWALESVKAMLVRYCDGKQGATRQDDSVLGSRSDRQRMSKARQDCGQTLTIVAELLLAWQDCLQSCAKIEEAENLFVRGAFVELLATCSPRTLLSKEIVVMVFGVLHQYIQDWAYNADLRPVARKMLSDWLGANEDGSQDVLLILVRCWHALELKSRSDDQGAWQDLITVGHPDSWYSLPDSPSTMQYMSYFLAMMIAQTPAVYDAIQTDMLALWASAIVRPENMLRFESALTTQILHYDAYNPAFFNMPFVLRDDDGLVEIGIEELKKARLSAISVLLQNMRKMTLDPDSQDDLSSLSFQDFKVILQAMMHSMRQQYEGYVDSSLSRQSYVDFINAVLQGMNEYTGHIEPINPWFKNGKNFPYAIDTFEVKFRNYRLPVVLQGLQKHMVNFLQTNIESAAVFGKLSQLELDLTNVFLDRTSRGNALHEENDANATLRTCFFQYVFPAYIQQALSGAGAILAQPVLGCIVDVYGNLRYLPQAWDRESLGPFTTATHHILGAAATTLNATSADNVCPTPLHTRVLWLLFSALFEILCRVHEMEDCFGIGLGAIGDILDYFPFFYAHALRIGYGPPCMLPNEQDKELYGLTSGIFPPTPRLGGAEGQIAAYASRELREAIEKRYLFSDGRWYHVRTRGPGEEVLEAITEDIEVGRAQLQSAVRKFVGAFLALH